MTQTPTPRREPRTEAGERLIGDAVDFARISPSHMRSMVLAIESEAVRQALSELEEEVGGLPERGASRLHGKLISVEEVIELIHKKGAGL